MTLKPDPEGVLKCTPYGSEADRLVVMLDGFFATCCRQYNGDISGTMDLDNDSATVTFQKWLETSMWVVDCDGLDQEHSLRPLAFFGKNSGNVFKQRFRRKLRQGAFSIRSMLGVSVSLTQANRIFWGIPELVKFLLFCRFWHCEVKLRRQY